MNTSQVNGGGGLEPPPPPPGYATGYNDSLIIYRLCRNSKGGRAHRVWGLIALILLQKLKEIDRQDVASPLEILSELDFGYGRGQRARNQSVGQQLWPGYQHAHFQDSSVTRERPIKS